MEMKLIEIRDRGTFIPALAIRVTSTGDAAGDWLLRRGGYSLDGASIILMRLIDCEAQYDPYDWASRTMQTAHVWLLEHFEDIAHGAGVDVEFILGERSAPKVSERSPDGVPALKRIHAEGQHKWSLPE
jgi:hypothetical protein